MTVLRLWTRLEVEAAYARERQEAYKQRKKAEAKRVLDAVRDNSGDYYDRYEIARALYYSDLRDWGR